MGVARDVSRRARGAGARRVAIWLCLVGLPLAYEASGFLPSVYHYYSGEADYWYAGLILRLVLVLVGVGIVGWALWRSGQSLADVGWPRPLRPWHLIVAGVLLVGALALALHQPGSVSTGALPASASTPVGLQERLWFWALSVCEAVGQELIWRGALIRWLEPSLGTVGAALLAGVSFVFFHQGFGMSWPTLRIVLPVTLVYTALFLWRKNVAPSTFLHFVLTAGQLSIPA